MATPFVPLLTTTDWNEEWKALQTARQRADDSSFWDEKAKTFPVKHGDQTGYVKRFLELAGVLPGETVLDMGCGTGALATPLAQAGNRVIACDFSQGMLDQMLADQEALGVEGVEWHVMSWADDWERFGLLEDSVDVALASRSIATNDLQDSLMRLNRVARRRACITLPFGPSPRADDTLMRAAGLGRIVSRDFLYAFNVLASCGMAPEVAYIPNTRVDRFETPDDALEKLAKIATDAARGIVDDELIAAVPERLRAWLDEALVEDEDGCHLAVTRNVVWAFIAWQTH